MLSEDMLLDATLLVGGERAQIASIGGRRFGRHLTGPMHFEVIVEQTEVLEDQMTMATAVGKHDQWSSISWIGDGLNLVTNNNNVFVTFVDRSIAKRLAT